MGQLDWKTVDAAIGDPDEMVRATAIRLSERFLESEGGEVVFAQLQSAFADDRPMVRLQLLLSLGELKEERCRGADGAHSLRTPGPGFRDSRDQRTRGARTGVHREAARRGGLVQ